MMTPQELRDRAARAKAARTSTVQITDSDALELAGKIEAQAVEIARLKTDHHALGRWPDCPTCLSYFRQDEELQAEVATLKGASKLVLESATASYQGMRAALLEAAVTFEAYGRMHRSKADGLLLAPFITEAVRNSYEAYNRKAEANEAHARRCREAAGGEASR